MKNMFIAFLLGIIVGAAGYWYVLQLPVQQAGQQAQQELVEIEAAHQAKPLERAQAGRPFRGNQRAELPGGAPAEAQRMKGQQYASHRRARPASAAREQRHPAESPGERFDD